MNDPALWMLLVVVAASLASSFSSICHNSLKDFNRTRLSDLFEAIGRSSRFDAFMARIDQMVLMTGMARTGFTMVVLLGVLYVVEQWASHWQLLGRYAMALLIAGALVSTFSVAIPISLARYMPERVLVAASRALLVGLVIFTPLVRILHALDPLIRRMTHVNGRAPQETAVSEDVLSVVEEHEDAGDVSSEQKDMIEAVFDLPTTTAGKIMTPRTEVQALPLHSSIEEVKQAIIEAGHSRIPVFEQTIDNVVGILYAKDLIPYLACDKPFELRKVLRGALMVPETKPLRELLLEFQTRQVHIALVLDEYGGTAGVVTIEDIIEELVGEIHDEYEPEFDTPCTHRVDDNTLEVDARMTVHDLNDELNLGLPEEAQYDTVGGFVFAMLGHVPEKGEQFTRDNLRFTITDAGRTKVNRVRIHRMESAPVSGQDDA